MHILFVRPLMGQLQAVLSMGEKVSVLLIFDKISDPNIHFDKNQFPQIEFFEWHAKSNIANNHLAMLLGLKKLMDDHHFDVIHLNALSDVLIFFLSRMISRNKPIIIATSHNQIFWCNENKSNWIAQKMKYLIDGYVAISTKNKNQLINLGWKKERVRFIPNAFFGDKVSIKPNKPNQNRKVHIVYVARVDRRKSQLTLIEAIGRLVEKYTNILVKFVGPVTDVDYYTELIRMLDELGVDNNLVQFTGGIPHEEVIREYQSADIVVFPSRGEMMPRAVIEAMWLGKPVIATAVDGILDLIRDRETGLLFNPGDSETLANLIQELVENPELAARLATAGQRHVQRICSPENVGKAYIEFYRDLLNQR